MSLKKLQISDEINTEYLNDFKNKGITNRIRWIEHNKIPILFLDYSNFLDSDETVKTIQEVNEYIKQLKFQGIYLLVDVRNSYADQKIIIESLKHNAKIIKPHAKKAAVIGVTSSQEFILAIVNMFSGLGLKSFETIDDAKDWLIE